MRRYELFEKDFNNKEFEEFMKSDMVQKGHHVIGAFNHIKVIETTDGFKVVARIPASGGPHYQRVTRIEKLGFTKIGLIKE